MKKIHVIETYMDNRQLNLRLPLFRLNPSCPDPGRWEKINLNFYFHTLWCLKRFYEGFQGLHKTFGVRQGRVRIKIYVIFYFNITFWNAMQFTFFLLIGIHAMQGWTATTRHAVTRKRNTKRLKHTENLLRENVHLIDVC